MEDFKKLIGKNISILRKRKKLTQTELANDLNYSDKAISKWEHGDSLPDVETLYNVANYFGVTLDTLVDEELENTPSKLKTPNENIRNKVIITLLSVMVVWMLATLLFVYMSQLMQKFDSWKVFIYAIPLSCIVLLVFNSIWGKRLFTFIIISVMVWSSLMSIYIFFAEYNFWMIFILGAPMQIAIILWSQLKKRR